MVGGVEAKVATTAAGDVELTDHGEGDPVLFVHGAPGGCDQGAVMTAFLVPHGFRIVSPSRPGYLGTALVDGNRTPAEQAALHLALMDSLGIDRFAVMCWSGGGPSSYLLAAGNPDRVTAVVALAAVSQAFTFENAGSENMLAGRFGGWLVKELVRHTPKEVVKSTVSEEGDLTKDQVRQLTAHIWDDPVKRQFVLDLMESISGGRKAGFKNDRAQFPQIGDLGLAEVRAPVLLVHGTADSDVPPDHSEHAAALLPDHELLRVADGTHVSAWTDPTSDAIQDRAARFLRRS